MDYENIFSRDQISKDELLYGDNKGNTEKISIKFIKTRKEAVDLCEIKTKEALKKKDAYYKLHEYRNSFDHHRNYEIEDYLEMVSGELGWRIIATCPFNGFNGLDEKYNYKDVSS